MRVPVIGPRTEFDLPLMDEEPRKIVFSDLESVLCEKVVTRTK